MNLLNDEEVVKIIQKASDREDVSIVNWSLKPKEGELTGFLGGYLKLQVEAVIEDGNPSTYNFFVKTLPDGLEQRNFMEEMNLFKKEAIIYSDMLSKMSSLKSVPKSYFSRKDILVMDDLALDGYTLMPPRIEFSQEHMQVVLKSLAEIHAASFHFEQKYLNEPMKEVFDDTLFEVIFNRDNTWIIKGLETIEMIALQKSKYANDPKISRLIKKTFLEEMENIYELVQEVPTNFKTVICHRDIWRNNLMLKFDDEGSPVDCVFVDFQLARCFPPGSDVILALYVLQKAHTRKSHYLENLKYYHECLQSSMEKYNQQIEEFLSFGQLVDSCEHYRLLGAIIKAVYIQTTYFPNAEMEKLRADDQKYIEFITKDRSVLLEFIETDEIFREWMLESVEELVEMLVIEKNDAKCNGK